MIEVIIVGDDLGGSQRQVPGDHDHGVEGGQTLVQVRTCTLTQGCPGPWDLVGL